MNIKAHLKTIGLFIAIFGCCYIGITFPIAFAYAVLAVSFLALYIVVYIAFNN